MLDGPSFKLKSKTYLDVMNIQLVLVVNKQYNKVMDHHIHGNQKHTKSQNMKNDIKAINHIITALS